MDTCSLNNFTKLLWIHMGRISLIWAPYSIGMARSILASSVSTFVSKLPIVFNLDSRFCKVSSFSSSWTRRSWCKACAWKLGSIPSDFGSETPNSKCNDYKNLLKCSWIKAKSISAICVKRDGSILFDRKFLKNFQNIANTSTIITELQLIIECIYLGMFWKMLQKLK